MYPGTGPRLTDQIQVRIVEGLVRKLQPRWTRMLEVPVHRPLRGVIDLVVHDRAANVAVANVAVAIEVQSQIRRLEQQLRWSNENAGALPSADFWRFVDPSPRIDRLLVLRSTRANREHASRFHDTPTTAYPASTSMAYGSLTTPAARWPWSAVMWATVEDDAASSSTGHRGACPWGI